MYLSAFLAAALSTSAYAAAACTAKDRLYYANQVPVSYSQTGPVATEESFSQIPFGVGSLSGPCETVIYPNGGPGIIVGETGEDVVRFGTTTRQGFYSVTGKYEDFPQNGTTVIYTNVTLGVESDVDSGVTFAGQVYLDFNTACRISAVRAFAEVPKYIDGQPTNLSQILSFPDLPLLSVPFVPGTG
ncbi:hypothetical protein DOTSEDRAFT_34317 [Dothistroma septosporum NZE10]|uniref:Uncharacterized protein n=1 Tax=Dothistroma septosporum (strain NZE10 / CBS 128990) TaxID=675120 RepID=N1PMT3_DOTSN|nr:hypothetical protein DOTSEDRAFT_34317 [Dothistroma septosporum NZE10]